MEVLLDSAEEQLALPRKGIEVGDRQGGQSDPSGSISGVSGVGARCVGWGSDPGNAVGRRNVNIPCEGHRPICGEVDWTEIAIPRGREADIADFTLAQCADLGLRVARH